MKLSKMCVKCSLRDKFKRANRTIQFEGLLEVFKDEEKKEHAEMCLRLIY